MEGFEEVERCGRSRLFGTGWRDGLDNSSLECRHWIRCREIRCAGRRGGSLECGHRVRTSRAVLVITLGLGLLPPGRAIAPAATSPSPATTAAAATILPTPILPTPVDPLATGAAARAAPPSGHARAVRALLAAWGRAVLAVYFYSFATCSKPGSPTAKPILLIQNKIDKMASTVTAGTSRKACSRIIYRQNAVDIIQYTQ